MKLCACISALLMLAVVSLSAQESKKSLVEYVNPLIGTLSDFALSTGNTYPAVGLPNGMNFWTPQTGKNGDGWQYTYQSKKICGFKQTHQPSPWINDYGCFSLMPMTGTPVTDALKRASWFSHKAEISRPHYYKVYLSDYDVTTEITPTERAAQFRFTFGQNGKAYILLDGFHKGSGFDFDWHGNKVTGYTSYNSGGVPENFKNYFVIWFDQQVKSVNVWNDTVILDLKKTEGKKAGMILEFELASSTTINAKVASSFISVEQAVLNLNREIGSDTFEQTMAKAAERWNNELGKIEVEGGTVAQMTTFYTALYRTLLFPRMFHEFNERNEMVHYSPYNGKVLPGPLFTDNGFWDTFRAAFPLTLL